MVKVTVEINGRGYDMFVDKGQEAHVLQLGEKVGRQVKAMINQVGQVGEGRLILMAALQLADEAWELKERLRQHEGAATQAPPNAELVEQAQAYVADAYGDLADKLETMVEALG